MEAAEVFVNRVDGGPTEGITFIRQGLAKEFKKMIAVNDGIRFASDDLKNQLREHEPEQPLQVVMSVNSPITIIEIKLL